MNVMGSLVGVDSLQVHDVPDDVVLILDAIASQNVTSVTGNVQGLATVVAFQY